MALVRDLVGKATRERGCCVTNAATNDLTQLLKMTSEIVESAWANIGFFLY